MNDLGADFIYTGQQSLDFMLPNGLRQIQDASVWNPSEYVYPLFDYAAYQTATLKHTTLNFVSLEAADLVAGADVFDSTCVILLSSTNAHQMPAIRRAFFHLIKKGITNPVIIHLNYTSVSDDQFQLFAPTDGGALFIDGLGDGLMLSIKHSKYKEALCNATNFGTLQASRMRISKTEYISCPSCGRTLFDLQETTAMIRQKTDHLKGIKIGIMGCIVNGPGEMADADYGYVGIGKDKIALYKGQEVVKKSVPAVSAVDELITLIKENGDWREPSVNE
jgi:(E)-4-hydroxy-3-methylbut-2-enyl-diphosphate synthase